mgnify:CR=1 FL=1
MEQVDAAERLGLDVMWLAELHFEPRRSVLSAPLSIASADRRPHPPHQDRHRRPGLAAVPSAAIGRGGGDGRSAEPRPADLRGRPQRGGADLRGLRGLLCREPRPLPRDPRHRRAGVDRAELFLRRHLPPLQGRRRGAEALPEADAADPHRRQHPRHLPGDRPARCADLRLGAAHQLVRRSPSRSAAITTPGRRRAIPARARSLSRRRPISPRPTQRHSPSRATASCTSITSRRTCSEGAARLVDPETAARRMRRVEQLRRVDYDEAVRDQRARRQPRRDRREAAAPCRRRSAERHSRRAQLRRPDPAPAGDQGDAAAVRSGQAPLRRLIGYSAACASISAPGIIPSARL